MEAWVGLCADISEATDILNSTSELDDQAKQRLVDLDRGIQRRSERLPRELLLHKDRISELPANAYSLHIQLHGIRVVIHRLLYKAAIQQELQRPRESVDQQNYTVEHSRAVVYQHAVMIAQLLTVYQQIFGIEQVITIMLDNSYVAAAVLISHVIRQLQNASSINHVERDLQRLRSIADMLLKAQKHYPVTVRIRFTLASLCEKTPLEGMFGAFAQRSHTPKLAPISEVQSDSGQQTLGELNSDIADELASLRPDMALFQDWGGENGDPIFQEMDWTNMMSWALSPGSMGTDGSFQPI